MRSFFLTLAALQLAVFSFADTPPAPAPAEVERKNPAVFFGVDTLEEQHFALLAGKQVGLITNQTGVDRNGRSTADILYHAPNVKLVALFSPEHGIRGTTAEGEPIGDTIDPRTHLPVYSLYGATQRPNSQMLNSIDVLVFDMQDVGARFYTYLSTMGMCMEAAAKRNIAFMVLDRPNPAGGVVMEGEVLDPQFQHFTAYYSIPVRHGMTAGEIAQWYNQKANLHVKLTVVPASGWRRDQLWSETGLPFVHPSPNIRTPTEALLYSGVGMFEATNVAVGRGTDSPFEYIGAPWMNGVVLAERLNALQLPGVRFFQAMFTPQVDLYAGHLCSGVRIDVTDPQALRPVDLFVQAAFILRELSPQDFQLRWDEVARVTGTRDFENVYKDKNRSAKDILELFHKSADGFAKDRQAFLLY
jgi:uncharacterized protein YbbC (DUF1343 family)